MMFEIVSVWETNCILKKFHVHLEEPLKGKI